jgi:hypothetical protein
MINKNNILIDKNLIISEKYKGIAILKWIRKNITHYITIDIKTLEYSYILQMNYNLSLRTQQRNK